MSVIERWHGYVERGDPALLDDLIAEECVFQSPAVHSPQVGKAITLKYLRAALVVLNGPSFRYLDQWVLADKAVLEFEAEVDGLIVNGVDMIWWNEAGQITQFKVMVRPLKALNGLVARMAAELQRAG
ncbi:nuclear transport factor 2 family protein [Allosphingosinicella sp.]|uniref:nuclear transport factor 2 family protein n=1 Tax=Allosphingosinicella sp. TaxID=2823234 RepID=UPI0037833171